MTCSSACLGLSTFHSCFLTLLPRQQRSVDVVDIFSLHFSFMYKYTIVCGPKAQPILVPLLPEPFARPENSPDPRFCPTPEPFRLTRTREPAFDVPRLSRASKNVTLHGDRPAAWWRNRQEYPTPSPHTRSKLNRVLIDPIQEGAPTCVRDATNIST
jgi:hypothetical protein